MAWTAGALRGNSVTVKKRYFLRKVNFHYQVSHGIANSWTKIELFMVFATGKLS